MAIWAMIFPPKAGRICTISVFSLISRLVQSAVSPVWNRVDSLGARERPSSVAPISTALGRTAAMQSAATSV